MTRFLRKGKVSASDGALIPYGAPTPETPGEICRMATETVRDRLPFLLRGIALGFARLSVITRWGVDVCVTTLVSLCFAVFCASREGGLDLYMSTFLPMLLVLATLSALTEACHSSRGLTMMVSFLILTGVALQILLQLPAPDGREASASGLVLYAVIATASGLLSFPFIWLLTRHMPKRFALPLLNLCILGVYLALLAFGRTVYNTRAWIYIGSFSLQLTEIAKVLTLTAFALEFTNEDVSPDRRLVHALGTLALNGLFLVAVNELGTLCVLLSAFIFLAFLYLPSIGRVFQTVAVIALSVCVAISCCRVCYERAQRKAEVQEQVGVVTAQGARIYAKFKLRADLILRPESVSRNDGGYQSARAEKALLLSDWLGSSYEVSIPVVESDYIFDYALLKMGVIFGVLTLLMMLCLFLNATLSCLKNPCQSEAAAGVVYAFAISFQSILAAASATGMFFTVGLPFAFLASGGSSTLVNYTMIVFVIFAARRFSQPRHATDAPTRQPLRRKRKEPIL